MESTTISFLPGGTSNSLVKSVLEEAGENYGIEEAAFLIAKGRKDHMDLTKIDCEYEEQPVFSFLCLMWAIIADCDINSEHLRWMGHSRQTLWGVYRVMCTRDYGGSLHYRGEEIKNCREKLPDFNLVDSD